MPLCTLHLLSLTDPSHLSNLLAHIHTTTTASPPSENPIVTLAQPLHWIIAPTTLDADSLLTPEWHFLVILRSTSPAAEKLMTSIMNADTNTAGFQVAGHYELAVGIPSRLIDTYHHNSRGIKTPLPTITSPTAMINPNLSTTADSSSTRSPASEARSQPLSQDFTPTPDLTAYIASQPHRGPISMLNLLCFAPGKKESYLAYSAQFTSVQGAKRGARPKIVASVIAPARSRVTARGADRDREETGEKWDEIALVEYPSLELFAGMLADEEYQAGNRALREPALRDTGILCVVELELGAQKRNDDGNAKSRLRPGKVEIETVNGGPSGRERGSKL